MVDRPIGRFSIPGSEFRVCHFIFRLSRQTNRLTRRRSMAVSNARLESSPRRSTTYALWIVQGLLALLFLFAGGMKLVMSIEEMTKEMPLPGPFLRFIGVAEVLGAIGL